MSIDFSHLHPAPNFRVIKGKNIDMVTCYKYLGILIDNWLKFDMNITSLCKREQQRQEDKTLMTLCIELLLSLS